MLPTTQKIYRQAIIRILEAWGEWVRETLLLDVPHRQVVFTIPKTLRIFFKFRRKLLGELCLSAVKTLTVYFEALCK